MSDEQPFKHIHQILIDASDEKESETAMKTYTYRTPDELRADATKICLANGTTLPAFLRACCRTLVRDYKP